MEIILICIISCLLIFNKYVFKYLLKKYNSVFTNYITLELIIKLKKAEDMYNCCNIINDDNITHSVETEARITHINNLVESINKIYNPVVNLEKIIDNYQNDIKKDVPNNLYENLHNEIDKVLILLQNFIKDFDKDKKLIQDLY